MNNAARHRAAAFTLLELMVVIALIAGLLAMIVTFIPGLVRSTATSSALNEVSATLHSARTVALRDATDAAVFFSTNDRGNIELRIGVRDPQSDPGNYGFTALEDRPTNRLPARIQVRGPDIAADAANPPWRPPGSTTDAVEWLAVWFGPDGTLRTDISANIYFDENGDGDLDDDVDSDGVPLSDPNSNGVPAEKKAIALPYLLLYDERDFIESRFYPPLEPTPSEAEIEPALRQWLDPNINPLNTDSHVLMFNRYSGNLLRKR